MAITEPGISPPDASPSDVGRHLRAVRKSKGLSRAEVARSAGLTRRELAAYERGRSPVPDSDLWCLAGSCGVDVGDLLPSRDRLGVGSDLGALTVGESVRRLRAGTDPDGVLREYLAMLYELRNLPPGTKPPMREEDLATLADALGGTPEAIEARLHELIGASREEAARLRSLILPPRPIAATLAAPLAATAPLPAFTDSDPIPMPAAPVAAPMAASVPAPVAAPMPSYPPPAFDFATASSSIGDADAADRFFSAPHAEDPFAPPPPLVALAPPIGGFAGADAFPAPLIDPFAAATFAPPTAAPIDPFAPPTGPPLATVAPAPVRPDGFVADLGTDLPDASLPTFGAAGPGPDAYPPPPADPFGAVEMVVLDVGPDGAVVATPNAIAPDLTTPDLTTPEAPTDLLDEDDDPFAVLRVPIEDADPLEDPEPIAAFPGALDAYPGWSEVTELPTAELPISETLTSETLTSETLTSETPDDGFFDAFANAYDAPDETAAEDGSPLGAADRTVVEEAADTGVVAAVEPGDDEPGDDEPGDDWFDRAAAAADALVAEQRLDEPPVPLAVEAAETADIVEAADIIEAVDDTDGIDETVDDPDQDDPLSAVAASEALPPIAWSLTPPIDAPVTAAFVAPTAEQFVAAGTDWQVGGIFPATAMADDGTLALRRADVRWALADLVADGDFTVRATVSFTGGAGFGILFRVSTDGTERITGYSFDLDPVYSGGGFLVRQWNDSRQHWKPLAHTPVADTARLYGAHVIEVSLRSDALVARIDGEVVMTIDRLSRASIDAGHEPCRGGRLGVQAWSTTEVTVDRLMVAHH